MKNPEREYVEAVQSREGESSGPAKLRDELARLAAFGTRRVTVGGHDRVVVSLPAELLYELEGLKVDDLAEKVSKALWALKNHKKSQGVSGPVPWPGTLYAERLQRVKARLSQGSQAPRAL